MYRSIKMVIVISILVPINPSLRYFQDVSDKTSPTKTRPIPPLGVHAPLLLSTSHRPHPSQYLPLAAILEHLQSLGKGVSAPCTPETLVMHILFLLQLSVYQIVQLAFRPMFSMHSLHPCNPTPHPLRSLESSSLYSKSLPYTGAFLAYLIKLGISVPLQKNSLSFALLYFFLNCWIIIQLVINYSMPSCSPKTFIYGFFYRKSPTFTSLV